jgi:hypothetical protein
MLKDTITPPSVSSKCRCTSLVNVIYTFHFAFKDKQKPFRIMKMKMKAILDKAKSHTGNTKGHLYDPSGV